jgi:hypothetical protein
MVQRSTQAMEVESGWNQQKENDLAVMKPTNLMQVMELKLKNQLERRRRWKCLLKNRLSCAEITYPMKLSKSIERLPAKERSVQHSRSPHLETVLSPLPRA